MRKSLLLFSLVLGLITASVQSCQKTDTRLPSQDVAKVASNPGNDLSAEDPVCFSCEGFVQTTVDVKGPYSATFESKQCEGKPWIDPYTISSSSSNLVSFPIEHDRLYKVRVLNMASYPREMSFVIANPPYPSISTGSFTVPAMVGNIAPGIAEARFNGRISCGCGWLYICPEGDIN